MLRAAPRTEMSRRAWVDTSGNGFMVEVQSRFQDEIQGNHRASCIIVQSSNKKGTWMKYFGNSINGEEQRKVRRLTRGGV